MRWWGWGEPGHPAALPAHALEFLRDTVGLASVPRAPVALRNVRIDPPALSEGLLAEIAAVTGPGALSTSHLERVLHAAGKGYPDLVRLRAGRPEGAPDAVVRPTEQPRSGRCSSCAPAGRWRSCRSAGARASSGAWRRCAAPTARCCAWTCPRWARVLDLDAESRTVTVRGGHARARARALPRRAGPDAGALPAVLRVRLARRLRRDALGRAGLDRLRRDRGDGPRPAPGGARHGHRPARHARHRRRSRAARADRRLGGDARRDQRARPARPQRAGVAHLRGLLLRGLRRRDGGAAASWRRRTCCRTSPGSRTSRRRSCRWRWPARAA